MTHKIEVIKLTGSEKNKSTNLVELLSIHDLEFRTKAIANMSFLLSGMNLLCQKGSSRRFQFFTWRQMQKLSGVTEIEQFDQFHNEFVELICNKILDHKGNKLLYGHAQKPVNVFLKLYFDSSSLPAKNTAEKIGPFLHVTLESLTMKYFFEDYRHLYDEFVSPTIKRNNVNKMVRFTNEEYLNIKNITSLEHYQGWQKLFRTIYPPKPIHLDLVYSILSRNGYIYTAPFR